ncbi:cytochrome c oxidase assembly protein [Acidipila sp. EB88]|uniref:cytochrome c oxidase assembly protein n=1 Tax=Acidipila sp. EB88 TaxID=2305226 RepID=UPI000F5D9689|nr:cytochrome c oxidase assembly protein [Acidipila sp. EB88]RRA47994.1 hypothetical protein D1Y84_06540 [Acidipila sp. EB88]
MPDASQAAYGFSYGFASIPIWASLALLVTLLVYVRGWRLLQQTRPTQIPTWRALCFAGGILSIWVAIASPLDALSGALLTAHMIQHLFLMAVAPPLLVLGAPTVPLLRGLPRFFVREGLGPFFTLRPVHTLQRLLGSRLFAWLLMNTVFIAWHVPAAYDLALKYPGWHEVEHACFLLTSVLFWWHIVAPWPSVYTASRWLLLPFLLSADLVNTALSATLSFSGKVIYPAYAAIPRFFGLSVLADQVAAGSLMWVIGSVSFLGAAMLITGQLLSRKGEREQERMAAAHTRLQAMRRAERATPGEAPTPSTAGFAPGRAQRPEKTTGALPADQRGGLDLLRLAGIGPFLRSRYGRQSLQALSLLVATAVIVDGLFGHQMGSMNLAGIVPWTYARGIFVLAILLCGNLFCMSCPFMLPREAAKFVLRRLGIAQKPWPRPLRNKWLPTALVSLFFWAYEALDLWDSPARTAMLLLAYFVTAFAVDGVFRDASFCKYVCPLGQFNFAASLVSPVEVAPRALSTCASCATRDCIAGHQEPTTATAATEPTKQREQRGCELHLFLPQKQGNMDCTLCMDCVKACPHDNVGLFVQPPAYELVQLSTADPQRSAVGRYSHRMDLAVLAATVVMGAFASAAVMVAPVAQVMDRFGRALPATAASTLGLLLSALLPALLLALLWFAVRLMRSTAVHPHVRNELPRWMLALLPIGLGMWAAHLSFHLVTAWDSLVPGVLQSLHDLGKTVGAVRALPQPDWMAERPLFPASSLLGLQLAILDAGLLGTLYLGWRMGAGPGKTPGTGRRAGRPGLYSGQGSGILARSRAVAPWALVAVLLYTAGVWILLQPMQMRGMVGM